MIHCERCQKKITEQTARIYRGRCVPCHRRRFAQAFPRIVGYGIDVIRYVICLPFDLVVWGFQVIRVWMTPLPFSRRKVVEALTPYADKTGTGAHFNMSLASLETGENLFKRPKSEDPHGLGLSEVGYPGTELYRQAKENGWFSEDLDLVDNHGQQTAALQYDGLSRDEIFAAVERFYKAYYFRPRPIARIVGEMLGDWDVMQRRLREGAEFLKFLRLRSAGV